MHTGGDALVKALPESAGWTHRAVVRLSLPGRWGWTQASGPCVQFCPALSFKLLLFVTVCVTLEKYHS